jgi:hypothetical protein
MGSRAFARVPATVGAGAALGALATVAMSIAMFGFNRLGLMGELPPEKITARTLDRLHIPRSRRAQDLLAGMNHIAFGAVGGVVFEALRRRLPDRTPILPVAVTFAVAIWAVSYAGWAPALGLMPSPRRDRPGRQLSMVAAHVVYGATLGVLAGRIRKA